MEQVIEELTDAVTMAVLGISLIGMFGAVFYAVTLF